MKTHNILVTGGAGYVGAVLVPKLLAIGHHVTVFDSYLYGENIFKSISSNTQLKEIKGDIRDYDLVNDSLKNIDVVIHLACISNDPSFELNPALGKSINYDATLNLVNLAKKSGVKRFIYASSSSVYGVKKEKEVTEELTLEPLTDYSKYKALCESYIVPLNSKEFTVVVIRPATVCGYSPRMRLDLTVNILTISAIVNKKITVNGGSQTRPNIHIQDMVDVYCNMLTYPDAKIAGKIFNAGYENYSVMEIAQMVKSVIGDKNIEIIKIDSNDNRSYRISSEKIKKVLGFIPKHTIKEAINDICTAYKQGLLPNPLTDSRYYNIKTMNKINLQ